MCNLFVKNHANYHDYTENRFCATPLCLFVFLLFYLFGCYFFLFYLLIRLFVCLFICSVVCLFVCLFVYFLVCLFVCFCLFVCLFVCLFLFLFVCFFKYHPFPCQMKSPKRVNAKNATTMPNASTENVFVRMVTLGMDLTADVSNLAILKCCKLT